MRCYKRALALDPSIATAGSEPSPAGCHVIEPRPSWLNNLLGALADAEGKPPGTPLRAEDSAATAGPIHVR